MDKKSTNIEKNVNIWESYFRYVIHCVYNIDIDWFSLVSLAAVSLVQWKLAGKPISNILC